MILFKRAYSNLKHAFGAAPLPHLGQSDHLSLLLIPAYTPLRRKTKRDTKTIQIRELSLNCRTVLNKQCGTYSNNRTWRNIYRNCTVLHQTLYTVSLQTKGFGCFLSINLGRQARSRLYSKSATPPSGQVTRPCIALPEPI